MNANQIFSVQKLERQVRVGVWDERNTQYEFPQANSSAEILGSVPERKILAKTQIACLLANMNNVQIKPPAPVELIQVIRVLGWSG